MHAPRETSTSAARYWRIALIVTSLLATPAKSDDAPADLIRRIIARETATQQAQANYTYQQTVTLQEVNAHGSQTGEYREIRDIVFSPDHERTERFIGKPSSTLSRLKLTDEDFRDIREVQPFLLTKDQAFIYETRFRGEETMDGIDCWVIGIRPRQILQSQRLFDGMLWVAKSDFSIIRSEGQAVPQIRTTQTENLFPHFTTIRLKVDGDYWFPATTYGDDTLYFRGGAQRMRMIIRYGKYQRFGADSKITFGTPGGPK